MVDGSRGERPRHTGQILLYRGSSLREWTFDRYWPTLMRVKAICGNVRTFSAWRSALSDVFPAGNECRGIQYRNRFQSGVIPGMWSPGRLFHNPGILLNLITGMTFMHHKACSEGWSAYCYRLDGYVGIAMPSKREGWAGCMTLARELSEAMANSYNARYTKLSRYASSIIYLSPHNQQ